MLLLTNLNTLSKKNFWFIDEVEKLFKEICTNSSQDALNKAAFKRIGYSLNIGYLYNDAYGTVVNYYDQEIFSKEILDLNNLKKLDIKHCVNLSSNDFVLKKLISRGVEVIC